jgi:endoglucanase
VWELHLYSMSEDIDTGTCEIVKANFYRNGFNAMGLTPPAACNITRDCPPAIRQTPVIISEFGSAQDVTLFNNTLTQCLKEYTLENNISWMMWSVAGSYRIRSGVQGFVDTWGLTNANWTGWIYEKGIEEFWKPWVSGMGVSKIGS